MNFILLNYNLCVPNFLYLPKKNNYLLHLIFNVKTKNFIENFIEKFIAFTPVIPMVKGKSFIEKFIEKFIEIL